MLIHRPVAGTARVFSSEDYESGELVTHSQSCRWIAGFSNLGDALNAGLKVHNALAATMIGLAYDEFQARFKDKDQQCIDARQAAKPGNFGFPGFMGAVKLVLQQRQQGPDTPCENGPAMVDDGNGNLVPGYKGLRFCVLMDGAKACGVVKTTTWGHRDFVQRFPPTCVHCIECAQRLKEYWLKQWPENRRYFDFVKDCVENGMVITPDALDRWPWLREVYKPWTRLAPGEIMQHVSGRIRGGVEVSSCANGFFQALLADACKSAHRRIVRECYDRSIRVPDLAHPNSIRSRFANCESPLLGSRPVVFQHDENFLEHPESIAHEAAHRAAEIMVDELRFYCPDQAESCHVEPALMRRWNKSAKAKWLHGGDKPANENDRLIPWEAN